MLQQHVSTSRRIQALMPTVQRVVEFFTTSTYARRGHDPGACDFALGNPHDMPIPALGDALQRWSQPQAPNWFAYQMSELPGRALPSLARARRES